MCLLHNIGNFEDHSLSNNLVLDMIIRNKEFQDCIYYSQSIDFQFENKNPLLKEKYYKKLKKEMIEKFGFDIEEALNLIVHHPFVNENITEYVNNVGNVSLILNPPFITDIKNGLSRVIDFYLQNKKLYVLVPSDYEVVENLNLKDVENSEEIQKLYVKITNPLNQKDDYILVSAYIKNQDNVKRVDNLIYRLPPLQTHLLDEVDNEFLQIHLPFLGIPIITFGKEKIVSLAEENFPIEFLDEEFISSLTDNDFINCSIKDSQYQSILPNLKLSSSRNINISLNPDLSEAELMAQIANLKLNKNTKSFVEVFNREVANIKNPNNTHIISKNKKLRNRDYANAFFIYDLYKIIEIKFDKKKLELEKEAEIQKAKIEKNTKYGKKDKQHEYNKIQKKLQKHLKLFNKAALDAEIGKLTNVEISKIRSLHALLKSYIDEYKFKNIILGK